METKLSKPWRHTGENGGSEWVLGHAYIEHPTFVTQGNKVEIGGTKLGNGGSVWVGFGTCRRRAYWASGLTVVSAHNSLVMLKKSFVNQELCSL